MTEQGVVVAIRLSDVHECDQPDPLCLRAEDLSKWRHLEVLLRNMYRNPPPAIKVTYLDNEDDWVQISCDEELAEAVRITQQSDNILLFQVKRLDSLITFENHRPANHFAPAPKTQSPSTQPDRVPLRSNTSQPLVYPHPSGSSPLVTVGSGQEPLAPLVYPHSTLPNAPREDNIHGGSDGNILLCTSGEKMASCESKLDSSSGEKFVRLKNMMSPKSVRANGSAQGLNSLSSGSVWEQAASLSSKEKLKFLKELIPSQGQEEGQNSSCAAGEASAQRQEQSSGQNLLVEPLCPENGSLGKNSLTNQDPFESMSSGHLSNGLEQVQLLQPTLTPMKASQSSTKAQNVALEIETDGPKSDCTEHFHEAVKPSLCVVSRSHQQQLLCGEKGRIGKTLVTPPVPLPRTLQMMEGAQSGANAVAIEIPESYHGAAHKEEDVTASGGASCTSASAETGEGVSDGSHHAAAYGREVKSTADPSAVSAISRDSRAVATQISSSQVKKKTSVKKKSDTGKSENGGARKKENGGKEHSGKKKPSADRNKKDNIPVRKEDKKVKADVESGEKTVSQVPAKDEGSSQYKDIVKYMRRMKKELHSNIVKDVTKQTDKLMRKTFERSMSCDSTFLRDSLNQRRDVCHSEVYCDSCNCIIYGIRYKCGNCPDFDLCAKCEALPNVHDPTHVFLKLRRPASTLMGVKVPLLQENIYLCDSRVESNSEDNAEGYPMSSQKSSDDAPDSLKSNANDQQELEIFKWYWDSFGTGHPGAMMDIESLSKSELKKAFQMLNSQEETEDSKAGLDVEQAHKAAEFPSSPLPSVDEDEEDQPGHQLEADEAIPVPMENEECGELEVPDDKTTDFSVVDGESTSDYQEIDNEECRENQEDLYDEASFSVDENFNVAEHRTASVEDSDTSDDFCVIDPPSRDEFEACGMEFSAHSEVLLPLINAYPEEDDIPRQSELIEKDSTDPRSPSFYTINKGESLPPSSDQKTIEESMEKDQCPVQQHPCLTEEDVVSGTPMNEEAPLCDGDDQIMEKDDVEVSASPPRAERCGVSLDDEDYLLKMTAKERREFLTTVEALKERARLLEQQLNEQKLSGASQVKECKDEEEVQLILKAKRIEAMRENKKLERMDMKQVADKLEKWQSFQEERQRDEKIRLQQKKEKVYQARLQSRNEKTEKSEVETDGAVPEADTSPSLHFGGHGNVVFVQTKKDANCQTQGNVDPATQASQMFQQITHGVSKAATSAFSTAKDVIYSLQAKQYEKKAASLIPKPVQQQTASVSDDTWTPPASVWTPPKDEYVPPKSDWTPPKSQWTPPKDEFVPPKSEWTPPKSEWTPPKSEWTPPADEKKSTTPSSCSPREDNSRPQSSCQQKKEVVSPTVSISSIPMADLTLHEERKSMQRLQEMGFANRDQNRKLLQQFDGDLEKVVQSLLQEEGGEHWAFYRH